MGLDAIELVMEVEDAFGILIPEDRACQIRTVGDLYEFVLEQTRDTTRNSDVCLSAATFFDIRRAVNSSLDASTRIRPAHSVTSTIPRAGRRALWRNLARQLDLRLPSLSRPVWLERACCVVVATIGAYVAWVTYRSCGSKLVVIATIGALVVAGIIAEVATRPFAIVPRSRIATFRGLSNNVLALNYETLSARHNSWTTSDVWDVLRMLIVEQLGVRPEDVTRGADFVHDLRVD